MARARGSARRRGVGRDRRTRRARGTKETRSSPRARGRGIRARRVYPRSIHRLIRGRAFRDTRRGSLVRSSSGELNGASRGTRATRRDDARGKIERMRRAILDRPRRSRSRADGTDGDVVGCAPRAARAIRKCARREGEVRRAREGTGDDARRWDDARDSFASHREARARDRSVVSRRERARGVNGVRLESGGYLSRTRWSEGAGAGGRGRRRTTRGGCVRTVDVRKGEGGGNEECVMDGMCARRRRGRCAMRRDERARD